MERAQAYDERLPLPALAARVRTLGRRADAAFMAALSGQPGPVAVVSHGGTTTDLVRTLAGDEALPPGLLTEGIPPGAITTLDDLRVVAIASTGHLG